MSLSPTHELPAYACLLTPATRSAPQSLGEAPKQMKPLSHLRTSSQQSVACLIANPSTCRPRKARYRESICSTSTKCPTRQFHTPDNLLPTPIRQTGTNQLRTVSDLSVSSWCTSIDECVCAWFRMRVRMVSNACAHGWRASIDECVCTWQRNLNQES